MTVTEDPPAVSDAYVGIREEQLEYYCSHKGLGYDLNLLLRWLLGVADWRDGRAGLYDDWDFAEVGDSLRMGAYSGRRTIAKRFQRLQEAGVIVVIWPTGNGRRGRLWIVDYAQLVHTRSRPAAIPDEVLDGSHPRSRRAGSARPAGTGSARPARATDPSSARAARATTPGSARPARATPPICGPSPATTPDRRREDELHVDPPSSESDLRGEPSEREGREGSIDLGLAERGEAIVALLAERLDTHQRRELVDPRQRRDRQRLAVALARLEQASGWQPTVVVERILDAPLTGVRFVVRTLIWRAEQDYAGDPDFHSGIADHREAVLRSAASLGRHLAATDGITRSELLELLSSERDFRDDPEAFGAACAAAGLGLAVTT